MKEPDAPGTAVALRWDGEGAPRVIAKGRNQIAERILDLAREHDVPVQANSELTALLAQVELGEEIPAELYLAVAQVIAFAYQVSGKTLPTASDED